MKKLITTIAGLLLLGGSFEGKAQNCILDQNITTQNNPSCGSSVTTFALAGSETDVDYFVVSALNGDTVSGPITGNGSSIILSTGPVSNTTRFFVNAVRDGYALNFDGTSGQQVDIPNGAGNFGTSDFTVEAWIKTSSTKANMVIAGSCNLSSAYWTFGITAGKLSFITNNTSTSFTGVSSTNAVNDGKWHHVAAVRNATSCSVYIDAALVGTANYAAMDLTNGADFVIGGSDCSPALSFVGSIDEVRLWSAERNSTDQETYLYSCVTPNVDLRADFTFEDGTGTTLAEYVNGYYGTIANGATWTSGVQRRATMNDNWLQVIKKLPSAAVIHSGRASFCATDSLKLIARTDSNAVIFNGANQYIDLNNHITDLSGANFTLEVWLKTTGIEEGIFLCSDGDGSWETGEKSFYIDNDGYPTFVGWGNNFIYSNQTVNDGNWHHVAVTWDDNLSEGYIYIDGSDQTDAVNYVSNNADLGTFTIGQGNNSESPNNFDGAMKQVRIWSTARSLAQVQETMYEESIDINTSFLQATYETRNQNTYTNYEDASYNYSPGTLVNGAKWTSESIVDSWNGLSNPSPFFYAKSEDTYNVTFYSELNGCDNVSSDTLITMISPDVTSQVSAYCVSSGSPVTLSGSTSTPAVTDVNDQTQTVVSYYQLATPTSILGQSFTAGASGALTGITLYVTNINSAGSRDFIMKIFDGNGFGGASLFSQTYIAIQDGDTTLPVTGVNVVAGHSYTWAVFTTGLTSQVYLSQGNGDSYAGGDSYSGLGAGTAYTTDLSFKTKVSWSPVFTWNQGVTNGVAFVPTVTKRYTVSMTDFYGCIAKDSFSVNVGNCISTDVNNTETTSSMKAYPNPGNGQFTIASPYAEATMQIYNSLGEIVYKGQLNNGSTILNLSTLENGIYTLKIIHNQSVSTEQLMIEK
jgi:hypothetical protein